VEGFAILESVWADCYCTYTVWLLRRAFRFFLSRRYRVQFETF